MNMDSARKIETNQLILDRKNPRLSEFGVNEKTSNKELLSILWTEMAVNELMISITVNGFWDYEPLIAVKEDENYVVIEGNRRLAAVQLLLNPKIIDEKIPEAILVNLSDDTKKELQSLPVIVVAKREDAWRFVGFKHVNGPAKWGSFAKAKYISEIHNDYNVPIESIANQIGDTNKTAQKLYQGLMVLEQAQKAGVYKMEDIQAKRIYFSHLYTGLQREGIRSYLKLQDAEDESRSPVPAERLEELGEVLEWMYGSKQNETQPIIRSQNPDLKYLDRVLQSPTATAALKDGEPLSYAFELSRATDALFEENLLAAKRNLQKARAYLTPGYKGEENLLKVAGSTADLADALYEEMLKISRENKGSKRISE